MAEALAERLDQWVPLAADVTGEDAHERANGLNDGDILLLENVRFDARETSKNESEREEFAAELAALTADNGAFVSDGFGVVHRAQASVYDVAKKLPHYAGGLVETELEALKKVSENPAKPYAVVLGGSKVSDKLGVIEALAPKVDNLIIGGGMCFTFLKASAMRWVALCCRKTCSIPAGICWSVSETSSCCPRMLLLPRSSIRMRNTRSSISIPFQLSGWDWILAGIREGLR